MRNESIAQPVRRFHSPSIYRGSDEAGGHLHRARGCRRAAGAARPQGRSPGVIDGHFGSNVDKALAAYREITGENLQSTDTDGIKAALAETGGDAFTTYTITPEDAAGPFVASVPADYSQKAKLDRLSFTSVTEMLAERFHMDEAYLKALNPEADFGRPGTIIKVANIGQTSRRRSPGSSPTRRKKQVRAYDAVGQAGRGLSRHHRLVRHAVADRHA